MNPYGNTNYVNLWFRMEWVRLLAKVLAAVGFFGVFIGWFVVTSVFGDDAGQPFLVGCFIVLCVLIVLCAVGAVVQFIRAFSQPPVAPNYNVKLQNPGIFVRGPVSLTYGRDNVKVRREPRF